MSIIMPAANFYFGHRVFVVFQLPSSANLQRAGQGKATQLMRYKMQKKNDFEEAAKNMFQTRDHTNISNLMNRSKV